MKNIYLIPVIAGMLAGCAKEYTFDLKERYVKPVLNAVLVRDSLITAYAGFSFVPGQTPSGDAADAVLKLYENGQYVETMERSDERPNQSHVSKTRAKEGALYRITAEREGWPMVLGEDVVPEGLPAPAIAISKRPNNEGGESYHFKVTLNDPAGERNYYRIRVLGWHEYPGSPRSLYGVWIQREGPNDWDFFGNDDYGTMMYVDDGLFNGRSREIRFKANYSPYHTAFVVEISHITRDAFLYYQTLDLQRRMEGEVFTEKVLVHNNIRNGLGIVGAMTNTRIDVALPQP